MQRIKKYSDRGFGVTWINTTRVLRWIKNRFHYAEWKPDLGLENDVEDTYENNDEKLRIVSTLLATEMLREQCGDSSKKGITLKELENGLDEDRFSNIMREFDRDSASFLMNRLDRDLCDALISGKNWKQTVSALFSKLRTSNPFVYKLLSEIS